MNTARLLVATCIFLIPSLYQETSALANQNHTPNDNPKLTVAVTIRPIHSLVSAVMQDFGSPFLLIEGAASPHSYSLRPSQARILSKTDILFRISSLLEPFTHRVTNLLPKGSQTVSLINIKNLKLHPLRLTGDFAHHHRQHAHGDKDDSSHPHHGKHRYNKQKDHPSLPYSDQTNTKTSQIDHHIWLDLFNAQLIVQKIASVLEEKRPDHASLFRRNAFSVKTKLDSLSQETRKLFRKVRHKSFVMSHDSFQYFEKYFGLESSGAISLFPHIPPGARQLTNLRKRIQSSDVSCVFGEPQRDIRLIKTLVEGTLTRAGILDPLGINLPTGPDLYVSLVRQIAHELERCLSPPLPLQ